jgi:hypothetical protein
LPERKKRRRRRILFAIKRREYRDAAVFGT